MGNENKIYMCLDILLYALIILLGVILIVLKETGVVDMSWPVVISVILLIPWVAMFICVAALCLFSVLLPIFSGFWDGFMRMIDKVKRRYRRRKVDRRIIRQAKAAGVWDKRPTPLGGRALELKAWKDFKIRRNPGESDYGLRRRCMAAAEKPPKRRRVKLPPMSFEGKFSLFPPRIPKLKIWWYKEWVLEQEIRYREKKARQREWVIPHNIFVRMIKEWKEYDATMEELRRRENYGNEERRNRPQIQGSSGQEKASGDTCRAELLREESDH